MTIQQGSDISSVAGGSVAANKSTRKALYSWELSGDKKLSRKPLELPTGTYLPCESFGLYTKQIFGAQHSGDAYQDDKLEGKYVDVQFVLTEDELLTLQSRIRRAHAETLANARTKNSAQLNSYKLKDPASIRSSAPFVDSQRSYMETYRPVQRDKWVDKQGFRPTNPMKHLVK